jgi:hypothetical protein
MPFLQVTAGCNRAGLLSAACSVSSGVHSAEMPTLVTNLSSLSDDVTTRLICRSGDAAPAFTIRTWGSNS